MANLLESYGLDFFKEDDNTMMGVINYIVSNGKAFTSYYGAPYFYVPTGHVELWVATERNENGTLHVSNFHSHCGGVNLWDLICTGIDLTPNDGPKNERILMLSGTAESGGMIPVDIINADVLPSFMKGDKLRLQIVAPCLDVQYYATEADYDDSQPEDKHGKKWLIDDGSLIALSFLGNHLVGNYEDGKKYDNDSFVTFKATVKALYHGAFELEGERENTFIRCLAETQYGEIEFQHSIDQVPEEMRDNIKIGAIISGVCILSADAAIDEYGSGIVRDFDHDLRLLRYTMQNGEAERLRSVLADSCIYETETSGNCYRGPDEIINRFNFVTAERKGEYFAHLAEITEIKDQSLEYPVGTKCIVLAAEDEDRYESIVFITVDEEGIITRIKVSTDGRYLFRVERPERMRTPLDDIEVPDSVAEPIMARARFHGLIDETITFEQIAEDPNYSSHSYNAREMLTALQSEAQPDMKLVVDHVLAYLFAKSVEVTINRRRDNPQSEVRLTASYSTSDAIDGHLASTLDPEKHAALVNTMELAEQFGNDLYGFMKMAGKTDDDFEEVFTQAAVIVQRIGELYAQHGFTQG